jgi:2-oxoisovalerate dehydrogenase E2 component (dihydrolipoyl transacylase)
MATTREFKLPDLGEGLEDAEVVAWKVAEGDAVELNQTLVEVNTAKAVVEIPSPWEGVVAKLHAGEGDVVRVGQPLVSIEVTEEARSDEPSGPGAETKPKRQAVLVGYGVDQEDEVSRARRRLRRSSRPVAEDAGQVRATPPVRKLAKELGVDLAAVTGTGPEGRVTREDVEGAARGDGEGHRMSVAGTDSAGEPEHIELHPVDADHRTLSVKGTRRLIAEKMSRSAREIPHVTTFLTVDMTWVQELRGELEKGSGQRITALPIVIRALVEAIGSHPKVNASFRAENSEIFLYRNVHVGVATDTEQGLLVPVIRNAQDLGIKELSKEMARLVETARTGKAKLAELIGSTVTVTNVGTFGSESGTPIINHPEAAILALGVIEPRALVVEGEVQARPAATLSLSFDHRVMDGAEAGRALLELKRLLESPFRLGALPG